jgi:hypothetical protein
VGLEGEFDASLHELIKRRGGIRGSTAYLAQFLEFFTVCLGNTTDAPQKKIKQGQPVRLALKTPNKGP